MQMHGWGRYPVVEAELHSALTRQEVREELVRLQGKPVIARGLGRSYGDSSLGADILSLKSLNHFIAFDESTGLLRCEAGVSQADILEVFVPRGWFMPVTPGTKFVTVGGSIASDIHGKNHHKDGCFSSCVEQFTLLLASGEEVVCSPQQNAELFHATCGGMGLTGIVLEATIKLKRVESAWIDQVTIKTRDLKETFKQFDQHAGYTYSVAWVDCLATGDALGRSVLMLGEHATDGQLKVKPGRQLSLPVDMPSMLLNPLSIGLFNKLYYARATDGTHASRIPYNPYFYPLDGIHHWNRLYGRRGFVQYQFVIPKAVGMQGMSAIVDRIARSGYGAFLAILKLLGPANANLLSFPIEGYSLALDFKVQEGLFALLNELDAMVLDHGGRIYLTKDARMSEATFKQSYPNWQKFQEVRGKCGALGRFASLQSRRLGMDV